MLRIIATFGLVFGFIGWGAVGLEIAAEHYAHAVLLAVTSMGTCIICFNELTSDKGTVND